MSGRRLAKPAVGALVIPVFVSLVLAATGWAVFRKLESIGWFIATAAFFGDRLRFHPLMLVITAAAVGYVGTAIYVSVVPGDGLGGLWMAAATLTAFGCSGGLAVASILNRRQR
jgi:hypothetical protein